MSIRVGAMFENLFASEALRRGLDVAKPEGHHLPFDLIVSNEGKKLFRVQVKGTSAKQKSGYTFATKRGKRRLKRVDYKTEIDVFVGIVERLGDRVFYLIPSSVLSDRTSIRVFPDPKSKAQFEKYRGAWEVFQ